MSVWGCVCVDILYVCVCVCGRGAGDSTPARLGLAQFGFGSRCYGYIFDLCEIELNSLNSHIPYSHAFTHIFTHTYIFIYSRIHCTHTVSSNQDYSLAINQIKWLSHISLGSSVSFSYSSTSLCFLQLPHPPPANIVVVAVCWWV